MTISKKLKTCSGLAALLFFSFVLFSACSTPEKPENDEPLKISGIYPHLAYYNQEGECGTGAVVPWAGSLWLITYGPHLPMGSSDKLYQITDELEIITRPESIGGTPANRMIHKESNQLFIGPYAIDSTGNVKVIPYEEMPGRHTGNARHLTDPENKIYFGTMEEGFYEVDVHTLEADMLYRDLNGVNTAEENIPESSLANLPGAHGKGLYSGQGVMVYTNNGELGDEALRKFDIPAGVLAEWDGEDWTVVRRDQFVEVTGPGGITGNENAETDPIWATGWDHKSVIVGVRDLGEWHFYRLPKASHTYDGAHGWNTEWPRIRDVGTPQNPDYLMTMHGMFWKFPSSFSAENTAGIRPRSAYLKVIGDFTRWKDQIVFGCDDSAEKEFLNKRSAKGSIEGPGQSNSNLWFTSTDKPDQLGTATASGAVWMEEKTTAGTPSEPFLFAGWNQKWCWLSNHGNQATRFQLQTDKNGDNRWKTIREEVIQPRSSVSVDLSEYQNDEWIRVVTDSETTATVQFNYSNAEKRGTTPDKMFSGLAKADQSNATGGLLYGLPDNRRALGILAKNFTGNQPEEIGYYELNGDMELVRKDDPSTADFIREKFAIPQQVVSVDKASVLIIDDAGRRWRLPKGPDAFTELTDGGALRICREVATERDLFNCHGTFYELPAENADGYAKIRPVATHPYRIHDYASYRGLIIMTGTDAAGNTKENPHLIKSEDGKVTLWAGAIDDLWKLGKPTGKGGPWKESRAEKNKPSDPYLIGFYDQKELTLSHNLEKPVTFAIETQPAGHGPWVVYKNVTVKPGQNFTYEFPDAFEARWIRFTTDTNCTATAWLEYK